MADYRYHQGGREHRLNLTGQPMGGGGEGAVWRTSRSDSVAKIYHQPDKVDFKKIEIMIANRPVNPFKVKGHTELAWPTNLVTDGQGRKVGFLMPGIERTMTLINVYNPVQRRKTAPGVDWMFLHTTARNTAAILNAVHSLDYVVGDIKESNVLVNNQALVTIIDNDSFQVPDKSHGRVFRCPVGTPEYTPPELIGRDFEAVDRTGLHDRFGLAVVIFLLLFGKHPFNGKYKGAGDPPVITDLIRDGHWVGGRGSRLEEGRWDVPLITVHPGLRTLFERCFTDGHKDPAKRPSAGEWTDALDTAVSELVKCRKSRTHWHNRSGRCHWCARAKDLFPGVSTGAGAAQRALPKAPPRPITPPPRPQKPLAKVRKTAGKRRAAARGPLSRFRRRLALVVILFLIGYAGSGYLSGQPFNPADDLGSAVEAVGRVAGRWLGDAAGGFHGLISGSGGDVNRQAFTALRSPSGQTPLGVSGPARVRVGDTLAYDVTIPRPGRVWIIQIRPDDKWDLVFPNRVESDNLARISGRARIPEDNGKWDLVADRPRGEHLIAFIWTGPRVNLSLMLSGKSSLKPLAGHLAARDEWSITTRLVTVH